MQHGKRIEHLMKQGLGHVMIVVSRVSQVGWSVDFTSNFADMLGSVAVNSDMIGAIRCLRAEGIKTALLTNNFNIPDRRPLAFLDASLFDVVSTLVIVNDQYRYHISSIWYWWYW